MNRYSHGTISSQNQLKSQFYRERHSVDQTVMVTGTQAPIWELRPNVFLSLKIIFIELWVCSCGA
jgi:hypothetical protein